MRACTKVSYPTPAAAAQALQKLRQDPARTEAGIHSCECCHAFHLTSDRASSRNRWTAMGMRAATARRRLT